ncbi:MAG: prepilin-type N-terminal cleavage/methylation domain-containing protein [bacterium]
MIKNRKGFTLIEVMIVVVILGILAAIAIPRYIQTSNDAKIKACRANIASINTQWETKYISTGAYGTLAALTADTDYFPDGAPTCPFGTAYADADGDSRVDTAAHPAGATH